MKIGVDVKDFEVKMVPTEPMLNAINEVRRIVHGSEDGLDMALATLETEVKTRNLELRHEYYDQFLTSETPMLFAISKLLVFQFTIKRETETDEETNVKRITSIKFGEDTFKRIDIKEFAEYARDIKDTEIVPNRNWVGRAEKLKYYMSAWCAKQIEAPFNPARLKWCPSEDEKGKEISKNLIKKCMQELIDGIAFVDDGKGKNAIKPLTQDMYYLDKGAFRLGKAPKHIQCPKVETVYTVITDIMNRIITAGSYSCDCEETKKSSK